MIFEAELPLSWFRATIFMSSKSWPWKALRTRCTCQNVFSKACAKHSWLRIHGKVALFFKKKFTFIAGFLRRCCSTVVPALLFRSCSVDIELFRLCRTTGKWKKRMQFNTNADNFPPSSLFSRFILFLSCRGCCPFRLLCTRFGSALRENSSGSALLTTGKWYKINPFLRL